MIDIDKQTQILVDVAFDIQSGKNDYHREFKQPVSNIKQFEDFKKAIVNANRRIISERMMYVIGELYDYNVYFKLVML